MKLITKEVESLLLANPLNSTDGQNLSPVLVKFFNPYGAGTWYALEADREADGDWTFFGLVDLGHPDSVELGYFTLSELTSVVMFGKPAIERDMYYSGYAVDKSEQTAVKIGTK
jgi:hypothetical protein